MQFWVIFSFKQLDLAKRFIVGNAGGSNVYLLLVEFWMMWITKSSMQPHSLFLSAIHLEEFYITGLRWSWTWGDWRSPVRIPPLTCFTLFCNKTVLISNSQTVNGKIEGACPAITIPSTWWCPGSRPCQRHGFWWLQPPREPECRDCLNFGSGYSVKRLLVFHALGLWSERLLIPFSCIEGTHHGS